MNEQERITYFAETDYRNKRTPFGIRTVDRQRHMYVIGKTGMGKSTLLENMAIQDIRNGEGLAFIDPHGATAELLLDYIPENRKQDVVYFAPFDTDHPVSFNIMEDVGRDKRHLVADGLMSAFKKIWVDAWSSRMEYILGNILLALLEYPDSTLLGVNRMMSDKEYRKEVVHHITDPSVKSFWVDEFAKYTDRYTQEATPAIQNKIGQFISNPIVRNIIGQSKSTFDIRKLMDEKKILIMNLSKGKMGEQNANLIGSMLVTKIYLASMSRADRTADEMASLPNFYFFVDEFQSFANESFADILSEARKYKLNLTIAHQYIEQLPDEVRAAVFGNVGSMVVFRVGSYDAEVLEKEFLPTFSAEDIVNLDKRQIYLRLMIDGVQSRPFSAVTLPPFPRAETIYKDDIVQYSRTHFATSRENVEKEILEWHRTDFEPINKERKEKEKEERRARGEIVSDEDEPREQKGYRGRGNTYNNDRKFTPRDGGNFQQRRYDDGEENSRRGRTQRPFFREQGSYSTDYQSKPIVSHPEVKREHVPIPPQETRQEKRPEHVQAQERPAVHDPRKHPGERRQTRIQAPPPTENRHALRDALSSILTNMKHEEVQLAKVSPPTPKRNTLVTSENETKTRKTISEKKDTLHHQHTVRPLKEIPEDVLRGVLAVDEK